MGADRPDGLAGDGMRSRIEKLTPEQEALTTAEHIDRFLRLRSTGTLTHQEHSPVEVMPGTYRVVIHRNSLTLMSHVR